MKSPEQLLVFIRAGIMPALGCTEPGAVALAAAYAQQALRTAFPDKLTISVDSNVYKNGLAVGIPGTGQVGLPIAAALGALIANPEQQLALLSNLTPAMITEANRLIEEGRVSIRLNDSKGLFIEALAVSGTNESRAVIAGSHTNLVCLQRNGVDLVRRAADGTGKNALFSDIDDMSIIELIRLAESLPDPELAFLNECIAMNKAAAAAGLEGRLGMAVGAHLADLVKEHLLADDLVSYAKILTAAGADARMSGENIPVMSVAGSGNHGLTAILPIIAVAERMSIPHEKLLRALAVSAVTTLYIKQFTGSLSALCGCAVAAATGASAAIVWMLGGNTDQIHGTIKNMIANLTGMICDGGKVGCALKLATAAGVSVETALLTLRNVVVPCSNGIIFPSTDATIRNLGKVSNPGMLFTDKVILDIMLAKETGKPQPAKQGKG